MDNLRGRACKTDQLNKVIDPWGRLELKGILWESDCKKCHRKKKQGNQRGDKKEGHHKVNSMADTNHQNISLWKGGKWREWGTSKCSTSPNHQDTEQLRWVREAEASLVGCTESKLGRTDQKDTASNQRDIREVGDTKMDWRNRNHQDTGNTLWWGHWWSNTNSAEDTGKQKFGKNHRTDKPPDQMDKSCEWDSQTGKKHTDHSNTEGVKKWDRKWRQH